jgi:hypothetical protein
VLKSATLAQLRLLQEDVVNWVARRQGEPLLRLRFDNVTKRVGVAAVGLHLPQSSFHAAWGLPPQHDEFIEFTGLRSPEGEEIPFEELDENGEAMLVNWEEKLREDNVYSLLYLDSREELADLLTAEERQQILNEFDAIDVHQAGSVTTQEVQTYAEQRLKRELEKLQPELAELRGKGDAGKRAAEDKERLVRERSQTEAEQLMQSDIDEDGTVELHEYFRSRSQQLLTARGVGAPNRRKASAVMSPRSPSDLKPPRAADDKSEAAFCPNCGKAFISAFCTGCGTSRGGGGGDGGSPVVSAPPPVVEKKIKKKSVKKKADKSSDTAF